MWRWCLPTVQVKGGNGGVPCTIHRLSTSAYRSTWSIYAPTYGYKLAPASTGHGKLTGCSSMTLSRYAHGIARPVDVTIPKHHLDPGQFCVPKPNTPNDNLVQGISEHISIVLDPEGRTTRDDSEGPCNSSVSHKSRPSSSFTFSLTGEGRHSDVQPKKTVPPNLFPVATLVQLLTQPPLEESSPLNVDTLCNLYVSAKDQSQLNLLSPAAFSSFVNLLGSLSLSSYDAPYRSMNFSPLVNYMSPESFREHWSFVIQILDDKKALETSRRTLRRSDHYWLMRAHIGRVMSLNTDSSAELTQIEHHLDVAKQHYLQIKLEGTHPNVHVPYLRVLLSQRNTHHLDEAVKVLVEQLSVHARCHPDLLSVLWHMVLSSDIHPSDSQKTDILKALHRRLASRVCDPARSSCFAATATIQDLSAALHDVVFSPTKRMLHTCDTLSYWALSTCRGVLTCQGADGSSTQEQWNCLVLVGMVSISMPSTSSRIAGTLSEKPSNPYIADWQAVCALHHFDNVLRSVGSTKDEQQIFHNILTALWRNWSSVTSLSSAMTRPKEVLRVICGTFFILAGRVQCRSIAESCHKYCVAEGLYESLPSDSNPDPSSSGRTRLLAEQLTAFIFCGKRTSAALAVSKDTIALTSPDTRVTEEFSATVTAAISLCSRYYPERAHQLQIHARRAGFEIPTEVISTLGISLADSGYGLMAVEYLEDPRLGVEQRTKVLNAVLPIFDRQSVGKLPAEFIGQVSDAMGKIYASEYPEDTIRRPLQCALLAMARSGYERRAVQLIKMITDKGLSYFQPVFWTDVLDALLHHRQFRLTRRIYQIAVRSHPGHTVQWQRTLLLGFTRGEAWALASRMSDEVDPRVWSSLSLSIARHVGFQEKSLSKVSTLRIPALFSSRESGSTSRDRSFALTYVMKVLVRSGRIRLAKKFFADTMKQGTEDASVLTVMGNEILHGSMIHRSKRNLRQVRKVLDTLKELVSHGKGGEELGLAPDRVTVNILTKAVLKCKNDVDSLKIRALFDRIILNGYPCPPLPSSSLPHYPSAPSPPPAPSSGPFGTHLQANADFADGLGLRLGKTKLNEISFERHVRPLYRMFIKAFYLRGDIYAAKKVVGILKAVQAEQLAKAKVEKGLDERPRRKALEDTQK